MDELKDVLDKVCRAFPGAYVSLSFTVDRHRPMFKENPLHYTAQYELYVSDIVWIEAATIPLLIERMKTQLLSQLDERKAEVDDVLKQMAAWWK